MVKKTETKRETGEDYSFADGLIEKIESGYMVQTKPRFSKKSNFSASTLTYNHGECPRYWYLAFDGQVHHDNSDAHGVANRTNGTLGHERIQGAIEASGLLDTTMEMDPLPRKYNKQTHPAMEFRVKTEDPPFDGYGDVMLNINDERVVGEINATGNIDGGNLNTTGVLSVTGNANVGNIGAGEGVFSANITAANIYANFGIIGGQYILGDGSNLTNVIATQIYVNNGNVSSNTAYYPLFTSTAGNADVDLAIQRPIVGHHSLVFLLPYDEHHLMHLDF